MAACQACSIKRKTLNHITTFKQKPGFDLTMRSLFNILNHNLFLEQAVAILKAPSTDIWDEFIQYCV